MKNRKICFASLFGGIALTCAVMIGVGAAFPQEKEGGQEAPNLAEMMARVKAYTQPGPRHDELRRFLGKWNTEMRITMMGQYPERGEMGEIEFSWLFDGRWLQYAGSSRMLGRPIETFGLIGYDNFKQSFIACDVGTFDTAMRYAEGDMDPSGKALITYGTLDEYTTGEHDKMVKVVWRFISDDKMIQEIHDLPIGEKNAQVIEVIYTRKK